ncbi:hypothetical protein F5J12DRAFT_847234 [Pisolithus orientalis]|uniref:uncharacterized protein n=1 Tax=Pisolithus orientalis TaxID=936130 RepID=UPI002224383B|nr:uncharacterized protein F5J12DRAFT_847234 [Pisolithus orientalis]KAI5999863.1 hypothetical protein F5J12DRAFT_847234 [Pisolithus orientalis]
MLPLPPPQPNAEEQSSSASQQPTSSFGILRRLHGSLTAPPVPQFRNRSPTPPSTAQRFPAVQPQTPDSYAPRDVYSFHALLRAPLPWFVNRRLSLPCIAHRVRDIRLTGADPSAPSYTYKIQASGLRPLTIVLPEELEDVTKVVRPWHWKLLGPSAELSAVTEEQLVVALERSFNALLLTQLPRNEHKRNVSSALIIAQPIDRASILKSRVRIFTIA